MKKIIFVFAALTVVFSAMAQKKKPKEEKIKLNKEITTPSGLKYKIIFTQRSEERRVGKECRL